MWKRKRFVGFALLLILVSSAFVGLFANVAAPDADRVSTAHGGEIGRTLATDVQTRDDWPGGLYLYDHFIDNYGVLPTIKGNNFSITVNVSAYSNSPPTSVHIDWGDNTYNDTSFGQMIEKNYTENGTYPLNVIIYHQDGYQEHLTYTVIAYDGYFVDHINITGIPSDIINNTFVYLYHNNIHSIARTMQNGVLTEQPLKASYLNMFAGTMAKEYITNTKIMSNETAEVSFYYMNASEYFMFVYNPAIYTPNIAAFPYDDIPAGISHYPLIMLRNTSVKFQQIYRGNFTEDFNTIYFEPSMIDPVGGNNLKLIWDNYVDYLGKGVLDGNFNDTEAQAVADQVSATFVRNLTSSDEIDIMPLSFEDHIVVDSTAIYNYVQNSVRVSNITIGNYAGNGIDGYFAMNLTSVYRTSDFINTTVDQHIVKLSVIPDTPYWDIKIVAQFNGWNITHIETSYQPSTTRAADTEPIITCENDTIIVDPTENTLPGNITVYLFKSTTSDSGAVGTTSETQTLIDKLMDWLHINWLYAAIAVGVVYLGYRAFVGKRR